MTAPIYGPWQTHNATPSSTCPPDAVGKRGQVQLANQTRVAVESEPVRDLETWKWGLDGIGTIIAYRILIEPVRGEVVFHGLIHGWTVAMLEADTHRLTLPTLDGALIPGEYIGPGGVITITEVR